MQKRIINNRGSLLLLNGTSSSGKSSILAAFHKKHPDFLTFNIDDWFPQEMLVKATALGWQEGSGIDPWLYLIDYVDRKAGRSNFRTEVRSFLFKEVPPMYIKAKEALAKGENVIIDTVFEYDPEYDEFSTFFADFSCFKILVYCPLDILLERVRLRNNRGVKEEMRTSFQSFEQFPALFKLQESTRERVIDTVSAASVKHALHSAIEELMTDNIPDKYIPWIKFFERAFIKRFKLDELDRISLVARHDYDLILNTA